MSKKIFLHLTLCLCALVSQLRAMDGAAGAESRGESAVAAAGEATRPVFIGNNTSAHIACRGTEIAPGEGVIIPVPKGQDTIRIIGFPGLKKQYIGDANCLEMFTFPLLLSSISDREGHSFTHLCIVTRYGRLRRVINNLPEKILTTDLGFEIPGKTSRVIMTGNIGFTWYFRGQDLKEMIPLETTTITVNDAHISTSTDALTLSLMQEYKNSREDYIARLIAATSQKLLKLQIDYGGITSLLTPNLLVNEFMNKEVELILIGIIKNLLTDDGTVLQRLEKIRPDLVARAREQL